MNRLIRKPWWRRFSSQQIEEGLGVAIVLGMIALCVAFFIAGIHP